MVFCDWINNTNIWLTFITQRKGLEQLLLLEKYYIEGKIKSSQ